MTKGKQPLGKTLSRPDSTNVKVAGFLSRFREVLQPQAGPSPNQLQLQALGAATRRPEDVGTLQPSDLGLELGSEEQPPATNPVAGLTSPIINPHKLKSKMPTPVGSSGGTDSSTSGPVSGSGNPPTVDSSISGTKLGPMLFIPDQSTPSGLPTLSIDTDPSVKVDKTRLGDRPLTWPELWAAWPILSPQEIHGARENRQPLDIFRWSDYPNLYGYCTSSDGLFLIHPPQRTAAYRMSPCQIAKLWLDRGMHLQIIRQIYELRWEHEGFTRFNNIRDLVKNLGQLSVAQRLKLVQQTLNRGLEFVRYWAKLNPRRKVKQDFVQTLVEYANAFMYTLPWFPEAGIFDSDVNKLIQFRGLCFAMIARAAGQYACQPTTDDRIVNIGWLAAKAVLWNAQEFKVAIIMSTC
ncbi:hypothetical protein CspeluHIS016_0404700 [Cutaneotrichosporon spelunceum]|uniref:Uncharacterized protein n=1 Tax=Cutaneotrichosporon spelunceum TaxID=1672016 RepID=A0AAD3YC27_9TREE|nr:hypothetical protein CspeluHIS016_0404700 [Cutaneotrichosporon spelunceum]